MPSFIAVVARVFGASTSELFITCLKTIMGFLQLLKLSGGTVSLGAQPGAFFLGV
jgi:hypothetical protein